MCGIAGLYLHREIGAPDLEYFVDELLCNIEHRGRDATGLVAVAEDGNTQLQKYACPAQHFIRFRAGLPEGSQTVLLHTRFATQGHESNNQNNHPVQYGTCFAVHNGHINNDSTLFAEHKLDRLAEVDSEIIAALANEFTLDNIEQVLESVEGSMATAIIDPINHLGKLVLAKGWSSPLIILRHKWMTVWASEQRAIKEAWSACFGTPPADDKFINAGAGSYYILTPDRMEEHKFDPKVAPKRAVYASYNYDSYGEAWGWAEGRPQARTLNNNAQGRSYTWTKCDKCQMWADNDDLKDVDGDKLCVECMYEYGDMSCLLSDTTADDECPTCGEPASGGEEQCALCAQWLGKVEHADSRKHETGATKASKIVSNIGTWERFANNERWAHDCAIEDVGIDLDITPDFVDWLLFRAPIEVMENKSLSELRERAEGLYLTAYSDAFDDTLEMPSDDETAITPQRALVSVTL